MGLARGKLLPLDATDDEGSGFHLAVQTLSSSPYATVVETPDGRIGYWNHAATRLYGYAAEETVGQPSSFLIPHQQEREWQQARVRILAGRAGQIETVRRHKDGREIDVTLAYAPVREADGDVVGCASFAHRHAGGPHTRYGYWQLSDLGFRRMLERTTLLACITDSDDRILFCNAALSKLRDACPSDLSGKRWSQIFGESLADLKYDQGLERGEVEAGYEGVIQTNYGPRYVAWTNTLLRTDPNGRRIIASLGEDVTARRIAEAEVSAALAEREQIQEAIFAAEAAERARLAEALHDDTIQVITAALLNLDRMSGSSGEEARLRTRSALSEALDRARLLLFELRSPDLDHRGLRAAVETLCRDVSAETGVSTTVDVVDRRYSDPVEGIVFRTVREAVLNARRHSNARTLKVSVLEHGDGLDCTVVDDGVGFDPEAVQTRPDAGLHLGLSGLAERVRLARGRLQIDSAPGRGTKIRFWVPHS